MKFSIQIKFIATLFLILISINHLNGLPSVLNKADRRIRDVGETDAAAPPAVPEETTNQSSVIDVLLTSTTLAPTKDGVPSNVTETTPKTRQNKFKKPDPYEPPEKTWKALQICGILTFFVIVLYYVKKITKKFERNHDQDM